MIAQIFIPTADFAIPTRTPTNEGNAEVETELLTDQMKIKYLQSNLKLYSLFYAIHSLNHYVYFI